MWWSSTWQSQAFSYRFLRCFPFINLFHARQYVTFAPVNLAEIDPRIEMLEANN